MQDDLPQNVINDMNVGDASNFWTLTGILIVVFESVVDLKFVHL